MKQMVMTIAFAVFIIDVAFGNASVLELGFEQFDQLNHPYEDRPVEVNVSFAAPRPHDAVLVSKAGRAGNLNGMSATLTKSYAVVGAPGHIQKKRTGFPSVVHLYALDPSGSRVQVAAGNSQDVRPTHVLRDSTEETLFGISLASSGDLLAIGGTHMNTGDGAVSIFRVERQGAPRLLTRIECPDEGEGMLFGTAVALSDHWLAVTSGSKVPGIGKVFLFERQTDNHWEFKTRLRIQGIGGSGMALALSSERLVIGAHLADMVYVAERSGERWKAVGKLAPVGFKASTHYGFSVATVGDRILVGSPAFGIQGKMGAARLYQRSEGRWRETHTFRPERDADLGFAVALGPKRIWLGAPGAPSVVGFGEKQGRWNQIAQLSNPAAAPRRGFPAAIAWKRGLLIAGSPFCPVGNRATVDGPLQPNQTQGVDGAACVFVLRDDNDG